ncbi:MAG: GGDEF domain-containing protein [Bacillus subtilis]|nr:GGDEF domain-containing protein [Bacillus subtilis]
MNSELLNSKRIIEKQNAELTKYNQLLKNLSERDVLTNAYNRRFFYEYCKNTLCKTPNFFPVSLISIDFNKFKYVNDHYGHEAGDDLLVGFVRIVRELIRSTGDIFRFGGDEFIILLRNTSLSDAKSTMKNIEEFFERKSKIVTIAFGIVSIEPDMDMHECDIHRFLKTADDLLYAHKRQLSELY